MIRWNKIAEELGYRDTNEMWRTLYPRFSIAQLGVRFAVSQNAIRDQLKAHDIDRRPPGGYNNQKFKLDEDMLTAIALRGVISVARERGFDVTSVYKALRKKGLDGKLNPIPKWPGQKPKPKPVPPDLTNIPEPNPIPEQDE